MAKDKLRLIKVSEQNYQSLKKMGTLGETFNDVIDRLFERNKAMVKKSKQTARDKQIADKM